MERLAVYVEDPQRRRRLRAEFASVIVLSTAVGVIGLVLILLWMPRFSGRAFEAGISFALFSLLLIAFGVVLGFRLFFARDPRSLAPRHSVREPLASYISRKYTYHVLATLFVALVAVLNVYVIGESQSLNNLLWLDAFALTIATALFVWGAMTGRRRRRYAVDGTRVTLPVGSHPRLRSGIPLSAITAVAVVPMPPPRARVPMEVRLLVVVTSPRHGQNAESTEELSFDIIAGTDAFGVLNLEDLVRRLPPETLDPFFARPWRERLMESVGQRP